MNRTQATPASGRQEERHEEAPPSKGNTVSAEGENQAPKARLPHERDESSDSQGTDNPGARRIGRMAHDDLAEGQQDTSKAEEMDATYHRMRQGAEPAPQDKPPRGRRGE